MDAEAEVPRPPRGRRLTRGVSMVLVLVAFTFYERATVLAQLERTARDVHARLRPPREATDLIVVHITDADYEQSFERTSPLDVERLRSLLEAIAAGRPKAIVVDLATAESDFRSMLDGWEGPPLVWAREWAPCGISGPTDPGCPDGRRAALLDFAGVDQPESRYGLVGMERDPDGVIRQYRAYREIGDVFRPGLAAAVMEAQGLPASEPAGRPRFISYAPLPPGTFMNASSILEAAGISDFGEVGVLRDRIVLVGGAYREARDEHATPLGPMYGVDVQAQVIQTELEGGGLRPVGFGVVGVLLIVNSLALMLLFRRFGLRRAFWIAVVAVPLLATLCSLIFARSLFALWPYLIPILVAVLVQQLYAHAVHYRDDLMERMGGRSGSASGSVGHE
jgi:CHASE2 domain-containing sensor protein